ncbi:MAG: Mu-like prophage major head subunit gpT family protein [Caulobacteraceae bacterium]
MIINRANLVNLGISFNAAYQGAITQAKPLADKVATTVNSSTKTEEYGWIGKVPNVRQWLGDRVVQNLATSSYTIKNNPYELTISVDRDDIDDDNLGIYGPLFSEMGLATVSHKDKLVYALLGAGFATPCFDGQPYFSAAHPVLDANGAPTTYANTDNAPGGGSPWFLIDASRYIKPIIFQDRKPFQFVALDRIEDENVFNRREYIYGVDARHNVGYGFPQFCWGSTAPLDAAHYAAARAALMSLKSDYGRPIGVMPGLLVVPPTLEAAALLITNTMYGPGGSSNEWYQTAESLVVPWLA